MKSLLSSARLSLSSPEKIDFLLDKRLLVILVLGLFAVVQALSSLRSNGDITRLLINCILYTSVVHFYYQRRHQLRFPHQAIAQGFGGILLGLVVFKLFTLYRTEIGGFWIFAPAIAVWGLILLAAGFYGIKQFWRLWVIMLLFAGVLTRIYWFIERNSSFTVLSAKVSSLALWYLGFDSSTQGQLVFVNDGAIDIYNGCTAFPLFFTCIELLIILYSFLPENQRKGDLILSIIFAFVWTFILSIIRLCIMALVVNDAPRLAYWHGIPGSNLFMTLSLIGCGLFLLHRMPESPSSLPLPLVIDRPIGGSTQKEWMVRGYLCVIAMALMILILWPEGAAQLVAAYQFPEAIDLKGWQMEKSESLSTQAMGFFIDTKKGEIITPERIEQEQQQQNTANVLMAGRRYAYRQNQISLDSVLTYVINSNTKIPHLNNSDFIESTYADQLKTLKPNTPYLIVTGKTQTHLTSCLTAQGQAIVSLYDFLRVSRIRDTFLDPWNFADWLRGKRLIWDRRCVWIHLSTPSDQPDAEPQLISAWQILRDYWQGAFPPL